MVLNLLIKPVYLLLIDARIQDVLGPEVFGQYFPLLSLSILLNILLDAGLANHMTRMIAGDEQAIHHRFSAGWKAKLRLFPLYFITLLGIGWAIGYRGASIQWLAWVGLNQVLLSAILYVRAALQGLGAHRSDAWISITDRFLLLVGLGSVLIIQPGFQLEWLVGGTTAALTLALIVGHMRLQSHVKAVVQIAPEHPVPTAWSQIISGWPYALLFLLMMTYHRIDAIMLERIHPDGPRQAGWYAMSYRLFEAANMLGFLFATLLLPYFSRMLAQKLDVRPLASGVSRILLVGGGSIAWVAWFWPKELLGFFYHNELIEAAKVLPWLMISFAFFAQGYVYSTLITARGELKWLNILAALGAVTNIILNAMWIPKYGAWGCALASAWTQAFVVCCQCAWAIYRHPGGVWWGVFKSLILHALACFTICQIMLRLGSDGSATPLWCLAGCLIAGLIPGIMDYRALRELLSDKMNTFTYN